jgi:hypothetical protein
VVWLSVRNGRSFHGRDDNSVLGVEVLDGVFGRGRGTLQIPPLRFAPVGMTKGRVALPSRFDSADDEQQVPPLRYAPVGMTILFGVEVLDGVFGRAEGHTAGPSTPLRFGRDDTSV